MKTSSKKAKGRKLQVWVCQKLSDISGIPYIKDGDIDNRPMGQSGVDVIIRGKALDILPFSIECKNQQSWSLPEWIRQTKENVKEGTDWLLFFKKNNHEEIVAMDASYFFKLYKELLERRKMI